MIYHEHKSGAMNTFRDLEQEVAKAERVIRPHRRKFSCIVATGVSGMSLGFPLALRLGLPIVIVRKREHPDEATHSGLTLQGSRDLGDRPLWVDDFVSSGRTLRRVQRALVRRDVFPAEHVPLAGAYLSHTGSGCDEGLHIAADKSYSWLFNPEGGTV